MIELAPHADGVLLPVRAQPGARRNGLRGEHDGALKVSVTQVAEKGKANDAIMETLANTLALRRSQIELVSGELSKEKRFLIRHMNAEELNRRIAKALPARRAGE